MSSKMPAAVAPGHRSRRASADVAEAILAATIEVLDEVGFADLTVEAVAARAGAAKTAVYRRWPSKVPLVVEALIRSQPELVAPDTGDLHTDMIGLWKSAAGVGQRSIERMLPVVTAYLADDDELMALVRDQFFEPRLQALRAVIDRAVARGQIRADADPRLAFDLLFGPLAYRWLRGVPPDDETIGQFTSLALQGLRPSPGGADNA
jgi:AcrR family transcriptional regulator